MAFLRYLKQALRTSGQAMAQGWQHLICALFNLRRRLRRKQLPDYPIFVLDQPLAEREPDNPWWYAYIPGRRAPLTLEYLATALERIAGDPAVKGVIFLGKGPTVSLPQAQSLALLFARFRQWDQAYNQPASGQGKRILFHLEQISTPLYVAACAADQIYFTPLTTWEVLGLRTTPTFFKQTLDQLGITMDVVRISPWKSAMDMFSEAAMSPEQEQQLSWLLDSWYADIVQAIGSGRQLSLEQVRNAIDGAPWSAAEAQRLGLIDGSAYEDELPALLGKTATPDQQPATLQSYAKVQKFLLRRPRLYQTARIGVISLRGSIMPGESQSRPLSIPLLGKETLGSTTAQQQIRAARQDEQIAAVVIYVDSPGGSALASDLIWREVYLLNQEKPVVVYMGDVAASGGYYIAVPGRKVVAQPATLTGSIGVVTAKPVTQAAYAKIGVRRQLIQRGAHADLYDDLHTWEGSQRAKVEAGVFQVYDTFKERVAAGRQLAYDTLDAIANGRVWTGTQALGHGLIDELGDFQHAVDLACTLSDLPTNGTVRVQNISPSKETLLAAPIAVISTAIGKALGLTTLYQAGHLAADVVNGEGAARFQQERYWLIAEDLPQSR